MPIVVHGIVGYPHSQHFGDFINLKVTAVTPIANANAAPPRQVMLLAVDERRNEWCAVSDDDKLVTLIGAGRRVNFGYLSQVAESHVVWSPVPDLDSVLG